jgi:hypothetical protein
MNPTTKDDFYLSSRRMPRYLFLLIPLTNLLVAIRKTIKIPSFKTLFLEGKKLKEKKMEGRRIIPQDNPRGSGGLL